jgi:hypothetical protein
LAGILGRDLTEYSIDYWKSEKKAGGMKADICPSPQPSRIEVTPQEEVDERVMGNTKSPSFDSLLSR